MTVSEPDTDPPADPRGHRPWTTSRALSVTVVGTIAYTQPVFLTGALSVQLTGELAFGVAGLGLAVGVFRGTAALASMHMGRMVDRLGSVRSLRVAAAIAAIASAGIAWTSMNLLTFTVWLVLAGSANAIGQPATNRLLHRLIPPERQGVAFGVKQAAVPTSTMLAGLAIPAIALTVGWRWAFASPTLFLGILILLSAGVGQRTPMPRRRARADRARRATEKLKDRPTIVMLALAIGLGMAGASVAPAFFVDSAVRGGLRPEIAGVVLAVASVTTILSRLAAGYVVDRMRGDQLALAAGMVLLGAFGFAALAVGRPVWSIVGIIVAMTLGWGFNGVFWFCLVRAYPESPARATGAVAPGGLLGSSLGPLAFGVVVERTSYTVGWSVASCLGVLAASVMYLTVRRLRRREAPSPAAA